MKHGLLYRLTFFPKDSSEFWVTTPSLFFAERMTEMYPVTKFEKKPSWSDQFFPIPVVDLPIMLKGLRQ